jgi:DNA-binding CsgD family transcriptional regulator
MGLAERAKELMTLELMLTDCLNGGSNVVMVSGPVASGKTALLDAFAERVTEKHGLLLVAAASSSERDLPFGVIGQLFRNLDASCESAQRAARLLTNGALVTMLPGATAAEQVAAHVLQGLCAELLSLAENGPLVISVDDVHHADDLSLDCLSAVVRQLRFTRILLVLSECSYLQQAHPLFQAELLRQPFCRRIRLSPLPKSGVAAMLGEALDLGASDRAASEFHEVSGGNPLLVRALIEDRRAGAPATPTPLIAGDAYGRAVLSCLHRSESRTLSVARGLAILGESAQPSLVGALLNLSTETVVQAVGLLNAAGLLDEGRFRHETARAAVLDDMSPRQRAGMHGHAAELLNTAGAVPLVVARHFIEADHVDGQWPARVLHEAAEQALTDGETDFAVRCLELADQVSTDPQQRATITSTLARAEWRTDPHSVIRRLATLGAALKRGHLTGRHAMMPINYMLWHGRVNDAVEGLRRLGASAATLDAEAAAELVITRLWASYLYPGLSERIAEGDTTSGVASKGPSPRLQAADGLSTILSSGARDDAILARAEQYLQISTLDDATLWPITGMVLALIYADRPDRAAFWCDSFLERATAENVPAWCSGLAALRAMISNRLGDPRSAEAYARAALNHISPESWGVAVCGPVASMLLATTALGKHEDALSQLSIPIPEAAYHTFFGLYYLRARGNHYLAVGKWDAALKEFEACGRLMTRWQLDLPAIVPWRTDAAQACLRLGRHRRAVYLANEQLARLPAGPSRSRGISLRTLAVTRDLAERPPLLREAIQMLEACNDRLELAYAVSDLGQAYQALGKRAQAREMERRANDLAKRWGFEIPGRTLLPDTHELTPAAANAQEILDLSDAELRVAALAAQGYTNRQIASRLFVTVSTVEQHLTRVYRKLKVSRRTDLPADLRPGIVDSA